jgi:hypothetical protein
MIILCVTGYRPGPQQANRSGKRSEAGRTSGGSGLRAAASASQPRTGLTADIDAMESAITTALTGPVSVLTRMRLACTVVSESGDPLDCVKSGTS